VPAELPIEVTLKLAEARLPWFPSAEIACEPRVALIGMVTVDDPLPVDEDAVNVRSSFLVVPVSK
jgi:hypothetical protein